MKTLHKNTGKIIAGAIAVLLLCLMIFNMYGVNSKYPSGKIITGESSDSLLWAG